MADYAKLLAAGIDAVSDASTVCRGVQAAMETVKHITKDDASPVTVADFASQAVVAHILTERLGELVLVGEESATFLRDPAHAAHRDAALAAARTVWPGATTDALLAAIDQGAADPGGSGFWTLDPIDGTKGFLRGEQYAVALAYIERGEPVVGILGCPNMARDFSQPLSSRDPHGCIYFCIRSEGDGGIFEIPADEPRATPVHIRRLARADGEPVRVAASVEKAHSNLSDTDRVMEIVDPGHELIQIDSQCKYGVVARGQADAYLRLPTKKGYVERIWDHAAGALVASEAGCAVTDITGRALDFSKGRGLESNRGIVCAPPRIHGRLLGAIRELGLA